MIAIINCCGSNIASVQFALKRLGVDSILTTDSQLIQQASHVILPGVGTAKFAMEQLKKYCLINVIKQLKQPVLGICLGMQVLYQFSEEENQECLGIITGKIVRFPSIKKLIIPHMGWNVLHSVDSHFFTEEEKIPWYVYFVHSYYAPVSQWTIASTDYGIELSAMIQHMNFFGMQFHPEKSGKIGEILLKRFLTL